MNKLKTINDVMLPMRVLNWLMGCGGIIEYPLENPHRKISLIYSTACALNCCLLVCLSLYYNNKILPETLEESNCNNAGPLLKILFYAHIFVTFFTIIMGWKRGNVSLEIWKKYIPFQK